MVIAEKSKLVRRIFQLGSVLDDAKRELDDILTVVMEGVPENDAPQPAAPWVPDGAPLTPSLMPNRYPAGIDSASLPLEDREGSSEEASDVYYETRTTADLASPGDTLPVREPMLDSD